MELLLMLALPVTVGTVALTLPTAAIVWGTRGLFGLRAGVIAGRIAIMLIALLPAWIGVECTRAMNVPPVIEGDTWYDNDANIRPLFFANLGLIPSAVVSITAIHMLNKSFARRLAGVTDAHSGAKT